MSVDGKPAHGHTRILSDSARKRNRKEVLVNYNKTRIGIGHQHECWMELKEFINVNSAIADVVRKLGNWDMHN
jgi:hypothetical protein